LPCSDSVWRFWLSWSMLIVRWCFGLMGVKPVFPISQPYRMRLLQRWRFHPAFPCPPCIPLSRCCPDRPQPWHRLPRRRRVFLRRVAMGTLFPVCLDKWGFVWGSGRGSIKHCPVLMDCLIGESQLGPCLGRCSCGSGPGVCGSPPCHGRLVLPSQVKETRDCKGSWTRRPEAPVP